MNPDRRRIPHSIWIVAAVTAALVGWVFVGNLVTSSWDPDPASREYVRKQLAQVDGVQMALPVVLPPGYDYGTNYGYAVITNPIDRDGPDVAEAREVMFVPVGGVRGKRGLPAVALCVRYAEAAHSACPTGHGDTRIERGNGQTMLTIYAASDGNQDLSAWRTLEFVTNLDAVTWLH